MRPGVKEGHCIKIRDRRRGKILFFISNFKSQSSIYRATTLSRLSKELETRGNSPFIRLSTPPSRPLSSSNLLSPSLTFISVTIHIWSSPLPPTPQLTFSSSIFHRSPSTTSTNHHPAHSSILESAHDRLLTLRMTFPATYRLSRHNSLPSQKVFIRIIRDQDLGIKQN